MIILVPRGIGWAVATAHERALPLPAPEWPPPFAE